MCVIKKEYAGPWYSIYPENLTQKERVSVTVNFMGQLDQAKGCTDSSYNISSGYIWRCFQKRLVFEIVKQTALPSAHGYHPINLLRAWLEQKGGRRGKALSLLEAGHPSPATLRHQCSWFLRLQTGPGTHRPPYCSWLQVCNGAISPAVLSF